MNVLIVEPDKRPYPKEIGNDLKSMQEVVGGYIETLTLERNVVLVLNEEGKLIPLKKNRLISNGINSDILMGTFFVAGTDDEGEFTSLTNAQMEKYNKQFYTSGFWV